tara:strand:- start:58 stop:702 length:645 start_codon:yes stop_codon:yes gene_type:complete
MVEILCPHCEGEIELDDDAKGEFACPLCDGEFEWGMDDEDDSDFMVGETHKPRDVLVEYNDNPALRITAGVVFSSVMGIYAISSIFIIIGGMFVSSLEGAVDSGTGFGAIFILLGIGMLIFCITGITFGVLMAKGRFSALITCAVLSVLGFLGTIVSWLTGGSEECVEVDFWGDCVETASVGADIPIFGLIVWTALVAMIGTLIFVPQFRYQFD